MDDIYFVSSPRKVSFMRALRLSSKDVYFISLAGEIRYKSFRDTGGVTEVSVIIVSIVLDKF
jgi:hypothetical protein